MVRAWFFGEYGAFHLHLKAYKLDLLYAVYVTGIVIFQKEQCNQDKISSLNHHHRVEWSKVMN